jgi:hypothetical protein
MTAYSHLAEVAGAMIEPLGTVVDGRELADIRPIGSSRRRADLERLAREMGAVLLLALSAIDLDASSWADAEAVPPATGVALDALAWLADAIERGDRSVARRTVESLVGGWPSFAPGHGFASHAGARLVLLAQIVGFGTDVAHVAAVLS